MGLAVSWEHWDVGLIPILAQWIKDLVLLQLWFGSQLWLRSDPWPGNSICHRAAKIFFKLNKKQNKIRNEYNGDTLVNYLSLI